MYEIEESKNKSERKVGGANNHFSEPTTSAKAWIEISGGATATRIAPGGALRPGLDVEEGAEAGDKETGEKGCDKEACAMVGLVVTMVRLVEMRHHQDRTRGWDMMKKWSLTVARLVKMRHHQDRTRAWDTMK
jgi:hypothetical protein